MDFLKDRPGLQLLLNGLIMFLGLLLMFWIQKGVANDDTLSSDVEHLKLEKADIVYVDDKMKDHEKYDKEQDERIETMRKEWREDHKEILTLIRGL
jgi:hypothetical protein